MIHLYPCWKLTNHMVYMVYHNTASAQAENYSLPTYPPNLYLPNTPTYQTVTTSVATYFLTFNFIFTFHTQN